MKSSGNIYYADFSHIYVEERIRNHPNTRSVCERFPKARVQVIQHYKDIFNRSGQDWREQKKSQKLILAQREKNFLYDGSRFAHGYGYNRFYYNALTLNCVYDCSYCYLQGMYPSANAVMFVNEEDYFSATLEELKNGPLFLCISYDTDLLAFEHILPYCKNWIQFARQNPEVTLELRTKSANYRAISSEEPVDNVILAWTISPEEIAKNHEPRTPPTKSRLRALKKAMDDGWRVRLCFDPLLFVKNWETWYRNMVDQTMTYIEVSKIEDISIGTFRMNKDYLRNIRKQRTDSEIIHFPFDQSDGMAMYPNDIQSKMTQFVANEVRQHFTSDKIIIL